MNKHLTQCQTNEEFLAEIKDKFPDTFFFFLVTVVFYAATHLIRGKALEYNGVTIGNSHKDVFEYLKTEAGEDSKVYRSFKKLYWNSRDARYSGFTTRENFDRLFRGKLEESRTSYGKIKSYFESKKAPEAAVAQVEAAAKRP